MLLDFYHAVGFFSPCIVCSCNIIILAILIGSKNFAADDSFKFYSYFENK